MTEKGTKDQQAEAKREQRRIAALPENVRRELWKKNLAELPEHQRAVLETQASECDFILFLLEQSCELDSGYVEIKAFIDKYPCVSSWVPSSSIGEMEQEEWEAFDDRVFADYGLKTRVARFMFTGFIARLVLWSKTHSCNAEVLAEANDYVGELDRRFAAEFKSAAPTFLVREVAMPVKPVWNRKEGK